ncbi:MAG: peptide ABC transporter permease [Dehalococcoidia bacterium]|nr:MAG: peptide ABC transporter permease [Dehalococcoidia bacterium]
MRPEQLEVLRAQLGLDRPLLLQYLDYLTALLRGDLGLSLWLGQPVVDEIARALPVTLELAALSALLALLVAIPVGVLSATRRNSPLDYLLRALSVTFLATPSFWIATLIILVLSVRFRWLPATTYISPPQDPLANLTQFLIPATILGLALAASVMRMTRSSLLEVLSEDYVRTARAKGLADRTVLFRHALRTALIPIVTVVGLQWGQLIGGSVIIETVFGLPGMGSLVLAAIQTRDYPLLQGAVLVIALWMVLLNLLIDAAYLVIDPRLRS